MVTTKGEVVSTYSLVVINNNVVFYKDSVVTNADSYWSLKNMLALNIDCEVVLYIF